MGGHRLPLRAWTGSDAEQFGFLHVLLPLQGLVGSAFLQRQHKILKELHHPFLRLQKAILLNP